MESKLITANTWFASIANKMGRKKMSFEIFRQTFLLKIRVRFKIDETGFDEEIEPVEAFVNKGIWLVMCPKCNGAEFAWEEGWFICCSCKNSYCGHKYRRLIFPKDRNEIEELLVVRPLENRNYKGPLQSDETLEDLREENRQHASELLPEGGG